MLLTIIHHAQAAGFGAHLTKPVDIPTLRASLVQDARARTAVSS